MAERSCDSGTHPRERALSTEPGPAFVPFPAEAVERSIPHRFEVMTRTHPDRLAVKTHRQELTYRELDRASSAVARAVQEHCGQGEARIGLLLSQDAPMIAAILGVLKAGKTFVPVDTSLPEARARYILEDSQTSLVLTDSDNLSHVTALATGVARRINIDELDPFVSPARSVLALSPDDPCWILYTSGSTGRPKGVVQTHRNVLHYVKTYVNGLHLSPDDRLTLLFSCSANAGCHEVFSAVLTGASLHMMDIKKEGVSGLSQWMAERAVTVYSSVPTVFRQFAETLLPRHQLPRLRIVKLVGEPVTAREAELYQLRFPDTCILVNRLGSTETGTIRWYFVTKDTPIRGHRVPVGYAVDENEILILDEAGAKSAPDGIGEIAVRSRYLSPGYWQRPDLTQRAFSDDTEGRGRIYRTGDLGRLTSGGCLLHLGRKDDQVKIRGYRVELAEVEAALLGLAAVREAAVVAREYGEEDRRLVAYVVPRQSPPPTVTQMRRWLGQSLPEHMIPSVFVPLERLPQAPNGKVSRRELPEPGGLRPELEVPYVAPRTRAEEVLAGIWARVLNIERVGVDDHFFELGGNSLLATRVISRVRRIFQRELPLRRFFETPTVAGLAEALAQTDGQPETDPEIAELLDALERMPEEETERLLRGSDE